MRLKEDDSEHLVKVEFVWYGTTSNKDKSGAYLFLPDKEATVKTILIIYSFFCFSSNNQIFHILPNWIDVVFFVVVFLRNFILIIFLILFVDIVDKVKRRKSRESGSGLNHD